MIRAWLNRRSWRFWMYLTAALFVLTLASAVSGLILSTFNHQVWAMASIITAFAILKITDFTMEKMKP
jgi:hypothetical protein